MNKCTICRKRIKDKETFCSSRCKQIDLGKWLSDEYKVETDESTDSNETDSNRND